MIKNKIRLLSKLAAQEQILGTHGAQDSSVHEDLSTEATTQTPLEVEFRKKSIKDLVFMSKTIGDKGLNHNFLSRDLVDTLLQMDSEKYRQNVLKK